jgi:hypothetical protein
MVREKDMAPKLDKILDVPVREIAASVLLTSLITAMIFLPAITNFGNVLFGQHDMYFFLWMFWHFENSLDSGANPFFASEIFHPYGISLALSTTAPFQSLTYWLLPDQWGILGKATFLQILSFVLGGFFSFVMVYRFTKSALPSMAGSIIYNFSPFHIEKALEAPNYSMAMPFVAMFFIFYYDSLGKKDRKAGILAALSLSLLLIALNELTVAIMAGFIVFIDIFIRYMHDSRLRIVSFENSAIAFIASLSSAGLFVFLLESGAPAIMTYTLPPLIFLSAAIFLILGPNNLIKSEKRNGHLRLMALCAIPVFIYIVILGMQPAYKFAEEDWGGRLRFYSKPVEYIFFPSELQEISKAGLIDGLGELTNAGVYLGPVLLLLLLLSFWGRAAGEEVYFRNLFLVCIFFSFPLLITRSEILTPTPFLAQPLFPMMAVLRESSRFIMFGLLFLSVAAGLLIKRIAEPRGNAGRFASLLLIALLIGERWPAMQDFVFDSSVPEFYGDLSADPADRSILIANFDYGSLLREVYYQTIHGKKLSYGFVSRFPIEEPLASLGTYEMQGSGTSTDAVADLALKSGYDYVVVHKAKTGSFEELNSGLAIRFEKVYEDDFMAAYFTNRSIPG